MPHPWSPSKTVHKKELPVQKRITRSIKEDPRKEYSAFHKWQDLTSTAADLDALDSQAVPVLWKEEVTRYFSASKHRKNILLNLDPGEFYGNLPSPDTIVFSMKKQLFLQNQSHLTLWNAAESSKSDSNIFLSPSSAIPLGICLAVTIAGGGKHGNALTINRLFFNI